MEKLLSLRAERRRREARRETFTTPELVTTRRSILGPPAEGRPGPSDYDDDDDYNFDDEYDDDYDDDAPWQVILREQTLFLDVRLPLNLK